MRQSPWEYRIEGWPGVVGGFVGRTRRPAPERPADAPKFASALEDMGLPEGPLVEAQQVHGARVAVIDASTFAGRPAPVRRLEGVDGLLTDLPGQALAIYVADCLAVFMYHRARPGIGIAHAGWRGLAGDIPGEMVSTALRVWGGAPEDLSFALSPCIEMCCFEVGEEVAEVFDDIPGAVDRSGRRPHVDLRRVATARLVAAGVPAERIENLPGCTRCEPERFASYRWDPERCGRNIALLALRG
ncbi:MAG: polyphenol oxidase family protein [Armatimonadetes bacterium]|nr:polyphenol oxidase family protein [Armatimonadota bacterium]